MLDLIVDLRRAYQAFWLDFFQLLVRPVSEVSERTKEPEGFSRALEFYAFSFATSNVLVGLAAGLDLESLAPFVVNIVHAAVFLAVYSYGLFALLRISRTKVNLKTVSSVTLYFQGLGLLVYSVLFLIGRGVSSIFDRTSFGQLPDMVAGCQELGQDGTTQRVLEVSAESAVMAPTVLALIAIWLVYLIVYLVAYARVIFAVFEMSFPVRVYAATSILILAPVAVFISNVVRAGVAPTC